MTDIMNTVDFQTQLTSIMEMLAKTAVVEICKVFEENYSLLGLEITRCTNENDSLRKKCVFLETELQTARRNARKMTNSTEDSFSGGLTDTGHRPAIDNVFGKEWCMNLWRHEESNMDQNEETNLTSSVSVVETVSLLDDEPDMIMIKEETSEESSSKKKTEEDKNSRLRRPSVGSSERSVAKSSTDFITYTIPSHDVQQRQAEKQTLDETPSTHRDGTTEPHLNPDEFVGIFSSNMNFDGIQNNTTASEDKKIECVFCGKTFNYLSYLKVHMRTHSGEKPYACTVCGKRFAQKTYLRIHQRIHSGERPYTCMDCGKSFSQKSSLNVHLRSHTGEKPYSCVECGKSYTYKHGFNTHQCSC